MWVCVRERWGGAQEWKMFKERLMLMVHRTEFIFTRVLQKAAKTYREDGEREQMRHGYNVFIGSDL